MFQGQNQKFCCFAVTSNFFLKLSSIFKSWKKMVLSMQRMVEVATMVLTLLKSECGISRILLQRKQIPQKDMVMRMHTIFDILNSKHCSFALRMTRSVWFSIQSGREEKNFLRKNFWESLQIVPNNKIKVTCHEGIFFPSFPKSRKSQGMVQTPDRSFGTKSKVMPYHLFNNMSHSMSGVDNFFG